MYFSRFASSEWSFGASRCGSFATLKHLSDFLYPFCLGIACYSLSSLPLHLIFSHYPPSKDSTAHIVVSLLFFFCSLLLLLPSRPFFTSVSPPFPLPHYFLANLPLKTVILISPHLSPAFSFPRPLLLSSRPLPALHSCRPLHLDVPLAAPSRRDVCLLLEKYGAICQPHSAPEGKVAQATTSFTILPSCPSYTTTTTATTCTIPQPFPPLPSPAE